MQQPLRRREAQKGRTKQMSEDSKKDVKAKKPVEAAPAPQKGPSLSDHCKFEECKHKSEKFGFCLAHYELYMEGIIRGDGKKPIDYAQKLAQFKNRSSRKVA